VHACKVRPGEKASPDFFLFVRFERVDLSTIRRYDAERTGFHILPHLKTSKEHMRHAAARHLQGKIFASFVRFPSKGTLKSVLNVLKPQYFVPLFRITHETV
jgi:hypothetical protein